MEVEIWLTNGWSICVVIVAQKQPKVLLLEDHCQEIVQENLRQRMDDTNHIVGQYQEDGKLKGECL